MNPASFVPGFEMKKCARIYPEIAGLIITFLLVCGAARAQSETAKAKSGVEILKLKWEKQVRLPRNFDPSVIPTNGIFNTMESRTTVPGSTQAPYGNDARRDAAARSAAMGPVDYFPNAPSRMPVSYLYSLTVRNVGIKTIQAVAWDYVFINPTSQAVVGNHHFLSYGIARPAQSVTLKGSQRSRPLSVLSVTTNAGSNKKSAKPLERAVIQCVLYEDETTWHNPAAPEGVCELLKNSMPVKTRKTKDQSKAR